MNNNIYNFQLAKFAFDCSYYRQAEAYTKLYSFGSLWQQKALYDRRKTAEEDSKYFFKFDELTEEKQNELREYINKYAADFSEFAKLFVKVKENKIMSCFLLVESQHKERLLACRMTEQIDKDAEKQARTKTSTSTSRKQAGSSHKYFNAVKQAFIFNNTVVLTIQSINDIANEAFNIMLQSSEVSTKIAEIDNIAQQKRTEAEQETKTLEAACEQMKRFNAPTKSIENTIKKLEKELEETLKTLEQRKTELLSNDKTAAEAETFKASLLSSLSIELTTEKQDLKTQSDEYIKLVSINTVLTIIDNITNTNSNN